MVGCIQVLQFSSSGKKSLDLFPPGSLANARAALAKSQSKKQGAELGSGRAGAPLGVRVGAGEEAIEGRDDGAELVWPVKRQKTASFVEFKLHSVLDAHDNTPI